MRAEYDFSNGVRGKYASKFKGGVNIVVLEPDIAQLFPDSKSVNEALRGIMDVAKKVKPQRAHNNSLLGTRKARRRA